MCVIGIMSFISPADGYYTPHHYHHLLLLLLRFLSGLLFSAVTIITNILSDTVSINLNK